MSRAREIISSILAIDRRVLVPGPPTVFRRSVRTRQSNQSSIVIMIVFGTELNAIVVFAVAALLFLGLFCILRGCRVEKTDFRSALLADAERNRAFFRDGGFAEGFDVGPRGGTAKVGIVAADSAGTAQVGGGGGGGGGGAQGSAGVVASPRFVLAPLKDRKTESVTKWSDEAEKYATVRVLYS